MKKTFILISCSISFYFSQAQVTVKRYAEPKVSFKGLYGKIDIDKEIIIPEIDSKVLQKLGKNNIPFRFAEPISVDISPFEQGTFEKVDEYNISRIKITALFRRRVSLEQVMCVAGHGVILSNLPSCKVQAFDGVKWTGISVIKQ